MTTTGGSMQEYAIGTEVRIKKDAEAHGWLVPGGVGKISNFAPADEWGRADRPTSEGTYAFDCLDGTGDTSWYFSDEIEGVVLPDDEGLTIPAEVWVPKFKEGDLIDYWPDGAEIQTWRGSRVIEVGSTVPGFEDSYKVNHPEQGVGVMHEDQMRLHALTSDDVRNGDKIFFGNVENSDAPTVVELGKMQDISGFTTTNSFALVDPPEDVEEDVVNHPSHYTGFSNGAEVIDITENLNFNRGNAVKYLARAGVKDPETEMQDLLKAQFYVNREVNRLDRIIAEQEAADELG